jgi:hypothetical protein
MELRTGNGDPVLYIPEAEAINYISSNGDMFIPVNAIEPSINRMSAAELLAILADLLADEGAGTVRHAKQRFNSTLGRMVQDTRRGNHD